MSNGLIIIIFLFLLSQRQSNMKYRRKLQRQHLCTTSYKYRFKVLVTGFFCKRFTWSLWRISIHANSQICTIHLTFLSMGMACFYPLARLLTGLLNIASQSNHRHSKQKSLAKVTDGVSTSKKSSISLMSAKLYLALFFAREILRVNSLVSDTIYVVHVLPP